MYALESSTLALVARRQIIYIALNGQEPLTYLVTLSSVGSSIQSHVTLIIQTG